MSSKFENRLARLEREAAPRTRPLKLGPVGPALEVVPSAYRVAVLAQVAHELLFGGSRESGPYPSVGLHPRAAELHRLRALGAPAFAELEAQIAAEPAAGPRLFGTDWTAVAHIFGIGAPPKRKRVALEADDLAAWKRDRWAAFLASPDGQAAIASGRIVPAPTDAAHEPP